MRRRCVRLRLALFWLHSLTAKCRLCAFIATGAALANFARQSLKRDIFAVRLLRTGFVEVHDLLMNRPGGKHFARQHFPRCVRVTIHYGRCRRIMRSVSVVVIFEVFEHVAYVQECVAIQADVDESRLHAR